MLFRGLLALGVAVAFSQAAFGGDAAPSLVQRAVNLIASDPLKAEQQLKLSDKPSAYAYLAYLYMTNPKVPVQNRAQVIDSLMYKAMHSKLINDGSAFGDVDIAQKYHYDNLELLMNHLRLVTDASYDSSPAVPCFIFRDHPREAFRAFGPMWGSTRDGFFQTTCGTPAIERLGAVAKFRDLNKEILGDPGGNCTGTIRYGHYRRMILAEMMMSLAPKVYLGGRSQEEGDGGSQPDIAKFLEQWSNAELWNKRKWQAWNAAFPAAEKELADYYVKEFKLSAADAKKCANVALWNLTSVYLGIYSHETLKEQTTTRVYECFCREQLTLEQMNKALGEKKLDADEASKALGYAILNDAKIEVIDELIKAGARLNPEAFISVFQGSESPLFSAVLRPDIVASLLKAGANVNYTNMVGKTALIQAIQYDALDSIKLLLAAGAKVNEGMVAADSDAAGAANDTCFYNYSVGKRTPLMYACAFASAKTINHLLDAGADIKAVDSSKATAESFLKDNKILSSAEKQAITIRLK